MAVLTRSRNSRSSEFSLTMCAEEHFGQGVRQHNRVEVSIRHNTCLGAQRPRAPECERVPVSRHPITALSGWSNRDFHRFFYKRAGNFPRFLPFSISRGPSRDLNPVPGQLPGCEPASMRRSLPYAAMQLSYKWLGIRRAQSKLVYRRPGSGYDD